MAVCGSSQCNRGEREKEGMAAFFCHFCICMFAAAPLLQGTVWLSPHDVGLWAEQVKRSWENEINQVGSTSDLVPPLHLTTSFSPHLDLLSISLLSRYSLNPI